MAVLPVGATVFVAVDLADYTVNDLGGGVFSATPHLTYPATTTVRVFRYLDYTQPFDFAEGGPLPAGRIEAMGDRLCMEIQQLRGEVGLEGPPITPPPPWNLAALGKLVMTWQELLDAITAEYPVIQFGANITMGGTLEVPSGIQVNVLPFRLVQSAANPVLWYGPVPMLRMQMFQGFTKGQITGTFANSIVYPEWWGLLDGENDIAINCAVQATIIGNHQLTVSLGGYKYFVRRPIDLRNRAVRLVGAGSVTTYIHSTALWAPDVWEQSSIFTRILPPSNSPINSAVTAGGGAKTDFNLTMFGTVKELTSHQKCKISGFPAGPLAAYNGTWDIEQTPIGTATVRVVVPFAGAVTSGVGMLELVSLDGGMETGATSASAIIWIGSKGPGAPATPDWNSSYTGVEGIYVDGGSACFAKPLKRIHCIAWSGWVEENSLIRDVVIQGFSGFGIGGEPGLDAAQGTVVINGLIIEQATIIAAYRRAALPVYIVPGAIMCSLRQISMNMAVNKGQSRNWVDAPADPNPGYIMEWPQFGMLVGGSHTLIQDCHIEGVCNAIHAINFDLAGAGVTVIGLDIGNMCNTGMAYTFDSAKVNSGLPVLADQLAADNRNGGYLFHHSCGVSCGDYPSPANNGQTYFNASLTVANVTSISRTEYLLRDLDYKKEWTALGTGRWPNLPYSTLAFYSRGGVYGVPRTTKVLSAVSSGGGATTTLTVDDTTGFATVLYLSVNDPANTAYVNANGWTIASVTAPSTIVVNVPFAGNFTGHAFAPPAVFNPAAPATDKVYFIGPNG